MSRMVLVLVVALLWVSPGISSAQDEDTPDLYAVAWSPDGSKLAVAGTEGVRIIDVVSDQELPGFEDVAPPVYAIAWSPDGNKLASSGADKLIKIWDVSNGTLITPLAGHDYSRLSYMAWSPDGTRVASAAPAIGEFTVGIWDMINYEPVHQLRAGPVAEILWTADSSKVIVDTTTRGPLLLDLSSLPVPGTSLAPYQLGPPEPCGSIALHPDGTTLAIGSFYQPVIYLWDVATNQQIGILQGHTDSVLAMDWRPDSDTLASVSLDGTLRTWDAVSEQQIDVMDAGAKLYAVSWSPDGSRLAYGGEDGVVKFVDVPEDAVTMPQQ